MQRQLELERASFNQLPELEKFFEGVFPEGIEDRPLVIKILSMVSLYRRLPLEAVVNLFSHEEPQLLADILMGLARAGWLGWDERREDFTTYNLPPEVMQKVFSKMFPMPMLEPPKWLHKDTDSPYLTEKRSQSVLGEYNGQRTNLDTLNILNQIPLRVNQDVLAMGLPTNDPKFHRNASEVYSVLGDNPFWITWQFDFRGRVYARGYHLNPQGEDWQKAIVDFAY